MAMEQTHRGNRGHILAVLLGAVGGGLAVALVTRLIPCVRSAIMQHVMDQMVERGCDPSEM